MKASYLAPIVLSLGLAACGGDDGVTPVGPDARTNIDAADNTDAAPVVCTVSTRDFGDKGAVTPSLCVLDPGDMAADPSDDVIVMKAPLEGGSPFDEIELDLFAGFGGFTAGLAPGTYPITGDELAWSSCGVCAFVNTNRVDAMTYDDDYFATGGTVTLTSVNGQLTGKVENMTYEHVTISGGESMSVGDNCNTKVANATFDAALTPPPTNKPQQQSSVRAIKARMHQR